MTSATPTAPGDVPALPSDEEVTALAGLAERLARAAGALVLEGRPDRVDVESTKTSPIDVVTEMDLASEALLRRMIAQERPHDGVLGEEEGHVVGTSGVTWVLDPIDGTVNYLYGIPAYAVSVAAVVGEVDPAHWTVVASCVHAVADGRTWTAALGRGAACDGRPIRVNEARPLDRSLVGTGFGYRTDRKRVQARVAAELVPQVRDIRRIGSSAIDMCMVATGNLDAYYERGLGAWDLAAASLVVSEAGGVITGLGGARATTEMAVAGPAETVATLVGLLEDLGAGEDG